MAYISTTIKVKMETLNRMQAFYQDCLISNPGEYVLFSARSHGVVITAYKGKNLDSFKVFFIGEHALSEASIWDKNAKENIAKKTVATHWINTDEQIGSDEVGTGDFFGPVVVVATYVTAKDIEEIKLLGVDDSKKLTDDFILLIGPKIIHKYRYSLLTVTNEKYNVLTTQHYNMNSIKTLLHNKALSNMQKKYSLSCPVFVDQFCLPTTYFRYLEGQKEIVRKITFRTKGESLFPSVALASVIARYSFLMKMAEMGAQYDVKIPFGASGSVDAFAKKLYKKIGASEFDKLVKKNFKNYRTLIGE